MSASEFVDSNVLVYAYSPADERRQLIAQDLLRRARAGGIVFSTQVLAEFAAVLLHKTHTPLTDLNKALDALSLIPVILPDPAIVRRAVEAHAQYGLHFYDGMIVAAAERGGCKTIWSEDFNSGQEYFGIAVLNPFK